MSYLLDTNVLSETMRSRPNVQVDTWIKQVPEETLFVSVLTLGEIRRGIETLTDKKRKEKLRIWLDYEIPMWFEGRVLTVDLPIAERWGKLLAAIGRPAPTVDSLLAATALHHELRLVTRNVKDFDYPGLEVINPWQNA
ncbi:MAG: type II toxin-antitoxin system VapC family toxin [Nitrospiraceae bacterium]|nr:type II toxin-antitoxin system VapC family toxin [Nitrospiraceae bacterium]